MTYFQQTLNFYRKLNDKTNIAETKGRIADILQARGELDKALRIHKKKYYQLLSD